MIEVAGNAEVKLEKSIELAEMESRIASENKNGSGIVGPSVSSRAVTAASGLPPDGVRDLDRDRGRDQVYDGSLETYRERKTRGFLPFR